MIFMLLWYIIDVRRQFVNENCCLLIFYVAFRKSLNFTKGEDTWALRIFLQNILKTSRIL
jgi:hypothetical protein